MRGRDKRLQLLYRDIVRQVFEASRGREPEIVRGQLPERSFDETDQLALGLHARVARVDDPEDDGLTKRVQPFQRVRVAAADVDADLRNGERRERVEKRIGREKIGLERERHSGNRKTLDGRAREGKVLRVCDERRLLDVDERGTRRAKAADLRRDRVRDRQGAIFKGPVMAVLRESRERERAAHGRLQLTASDATRELEVAHQRRPFGRDRSGDDRLTEIGVVVVEALERATVAAGPRAREWCEQIVPTHLAIVDHVEACPVELADRPTRALIEHAREPVSIELAAVVAVQRPTQILVLVRDLGIRTDHRRLHGLLLHFRSRQQTGTLDDERNGFGPFDRVDVDAVNAGERAQRLDRFDGDGDAFLLSVGRLPDPIDDLLAERDARARA